LSRVVAPPLGRDFFFQTPAPPLRPERSTDNAAVELSRRDYPLVIWVSKAAYPTTGNAAVVRKWRAKTLCAYDMRHKLVGQGRAIVRARRQDQPPHAAPAPPNRVNRALQLTDSAENARISSSPCTPQAGYLVASRPMIKGQSHLRPKRSFDFTAISKPSRAGIKDRQRKDWSRQA
jgi:hypothetical protein